MKKRTPDFENNILRILKKEKAERATLFELFLDYEHEVAVAGHRECDDSPLGRTRLTVEAMAKAGYDYATASEVGFSFRPAGRQKADTISLNGDALICDWESFEKFSWPDPDSANYDILDKIKPYLPEGMKLMIKGPGGVLENAMNLVGYDNMCIMLFEEPELLKEIFDSIGSRMIRFYENAASADTIGIVAANDDWGFNTQTFLSPEDMRKYVFPWHKKIVEIAHKNSKPCILHSCGYFDSVIDDIINDMKYDGRHSYEDNIVPVEQAYEKLCGRIVVMGGIDMNFLATKSPEEIYARSRAMLERSAERGGYLLGSGNSAAKFIPLENYLAMTRAALEFDN